MNPPMDPDCRAGKHAACGATAWDENIDDLVDCACPCHTNHEVGEGR